MEVLYSGTRNRIVQLLVYCIFVRLLLNKSFPGGSMQTETGMECGWVEGQVVLLASAVAWAGLGGLLA